MALQLPVQLTSDVSKSLTRRAKLALIKRAGNMADKKWAAREHKYTYLRSVYSGMEEDVNKACNPAEDNIK